ncbi:ABC transporter permease [Sporolactobacillus putidus]|uniref:Peptide ABC transporter permease n=1 Tax=Sporolactobacillus putidus TaxID=492735 RepID=A0A917RYV9_9BACL|nr:ABC transporter permease [Sporolactobacillus putidus]GGL45800.1 peptide ABC transporter permease [Sporolactobacillus putidus]
MGRYVLKRIGYMFATLYVVITLTFLSMKLLPGTPFKNANRLSPVQLNQLKHFYGLDQPIPVQYVKYMWNFIHGDMGGSFQFGMQPVSQLLMAKFPVSLDLGFEAIIVGTLLGILLGIVAGLHRGKALDWGTMAVSIFGISIPSFIFAGILQYLFGVQVRWFPVAGWSGFASHVLPVISLAVYVLALVARFMRSEMVEVMSQDYIVTAEAKGLSTSAVVFKHAVRNALIPVITILGPLTAMIITGSLVVEEIFGIPGIGAQFVDSVVTNDYPMIMGTTELYAALFIITMLIVDILYGIIDPRIRLSEGGQS